MFVIRDVVKSSQISSLLIHNVHSVDNHLSVAFDSRYCQAADCPPLISPSIIDLDAVAAAHTIRLLPAMKTVSETVTDVERGDHANDDLTNHVVHTVTWHRISVTVSKRGGCSHDILCDVDGLAAAGARDF